MSGSVVGRRLVLTGASRGIGAAFARDLLQAGARVVLVARDRARLAELAELGEGTPLVADLLTCEPGELIERACEILGGLDGLINCAGIVEYAGVGALTPDAITRQLAINFTVPLLLSQAAAAPMRTAGGGDIISVASTLGERPAPLTTVYAASKAALISMTRSLAFELAAFGVRVNAIAPGVVDTDMVRVARTAPDEGPLSPAEVERRVAAQLHDLARAHLLGRLGEVGEMVGALRYLLASDWVTGTVLTVDGGLSLSS